MNWFNKLSKWLSERSEDYELQLLVRNVERYVNMSLDLDHKDFADDLKKIEALGDASAIPGLKKARAEAMRHQRATESATDELAVFASGHHYANIREIDRTIEALQRSTLDSPDAQDRSL